MRIAGYTTRGPNLVVVAARLWSPVERLKDQTDFLTVRVLAVRGEADVLLAEWRQEIESLEAQRHMNMAGVGSLNYPLQDGDVICVEWEKEGSPISVTGMSVEVQASRVGQVGEPVAEERPGLPGAREVVRPLFRGGELANDLNASGLPDMAIPFYLYED